MKKFLTIIFFNLLIVSQLFAESKTSKTWIRNDKGGLEEQEVILENLIDARFAETKHFKIVEARHDKPVELNDSPNGLKAANVLYHLNIAHKYFAERLGSRFVKEAKQTIVRIEMKDSFVGEFHWANEKFNNNYNNAETVPPSDSNKFAGIQEWSNEIWFRPMKKTKVKSDTERMGELMDNANYKNMVRESYVEKSATNSLSEIINTKSAAYVQFELQYLLSMVAFVELFPKGMKLIGKTHKKTTFLDTVMVPEIIYHEYSHVALYDYLAFDEKTPVVEGMANYFASQILGQSELGFKLKKFGKNLGGYSGKSKKNYTYENETKEHSHSNFLLSLMTRLDAEFENFDLIVFKARTLLDKNSDIKYDMVHALREVISETSGNSKVAELKYTKILNEFGL